MVGYQPCRKLDKSYKKGVENCKNSRQSKIQFPITLITGAKLLHLEQYGYLTCPNLFFEYVLWINLTKFNQFRSSCTWKNEEGEQKQQKTAKFKQKNLWKIFCETLLWQNDLIIGSNHSHILAVIGFWWILAVPFF